MKFIFFVIGVVLFFINGISYSASGTIVNITSDYAKEIKINLRTHLDPPGVSCLPPFILYPGQQREIHYTDVVSGCKEATLFILDVTRFVTHHTLIKAPSLCITRLNQFHVTTTECHPAS